MRRNIQHWFLCGIVIGSTLALAVVAAAAARAIAASGDLHAYPAFVFAAVIGGACWLFKRDGHPVRRRYASGYCFISKERKARIEDVL